MPWGRCLVFHIKYLVGSRRWPKFYKMYFHFLWPFTASWRFLISRRHVLSDIFTCLGYMAKRIFLVMISLVTQNNAVALCYDLSHWKRREKITCWYLTEFFYIWKCDSFILERNSLVLFLSHWLRSKQLYRILTSVQFRDMCWGTYTQVGLDWVFHGPEGDSAVLCPWNLPVVLSY